MKLLNNSGPAIFMYSVIAICIIISSICFGCFYGGKTESMIILWIGIVAFTIMYHFWVRIIMGNVLKLFKKHITYKQVFFREKKFEKNIYAKIRVKEWKDKVLTYAPAEFDLKENSLETVANNMAKAELDHWINSLISLSTISFGTIFSVTYLPFIISAICAMMFETQFIILQRFNRPRVVKLLEREERKNKENKEENTVNNIEDKIEETINN